MTEELWYEPGTPGIGLKFKPIRYLGPMVWGAYQDIDGKWHKTLVWKRDVT
jgi:hypothetical protein